MSSTIATSGDPIVRVHRSVADSARAAAAGLPVVNAVGMRAGHAGMLEGAIAETRATLGELARVADVGASGAGALGDQDSESGRKFGGVREVRRG
ncbi:hypothetical protein [Mycobacteroides abscessus]|uniref:Uncharacterized protein n=1 Tax=Mycobacteroides abscessus subsp. abscessus TaxID=1185650 RepID=A0AB38D6W8_9MYCO|nr:hypothetical protein [Mycobacteroides abscessus]SIC00042.1 Uncharacterised protein [Mycobacteroides abscessus subsp. abscessus]SIC25515.1 Uncharacterised protein [Mycobacteroides abscessus subsp. abscessus]SIC25733.1 Uncharacterised protein [Mycobacteroides abscessus subsp. abscessus]SIC33974.1 Uncharacterised protein [Mycobacteroides abscessus subsp. abscessus]SIF78003.1 Uncharacterised protein [Mycobacteroides abscessus subsp. abscessus]